MEVEQINVDQLTKLLRQCEPDILEGRKKLSLTASLLQKINYSLQELEYDHVSFSKSSSTSEESIKFLQELIHKTPKLTVTQKIKRETWRVDISRFNSLKYLELSRIPMHLVEGMQSLRSQLEVLICERCTDCLEEILGASENIWEELRTAKLCYNDFVLLCPFTSTPWLQYLDLSYNKIEDRVSLQTLKNLRYLNLSYNFLTSVPVLNEAVCHKLKVLLIHNNYLQDLAALSVFDSLEVLNVSDNLLADHSAISPILFLPNLKSINLAKNPISYHPHHRFHTCSYLNKAIIAHEFLLDGRPLNPLEQKEIGRRGETYRHLGITLPRELTCLPSGSLSQPVPKSVSKKKVRDVVIEEGTSNSKPKVLVKLPETNQEHLQTKKQVEELRERYGVDHWLHSQAGSYIQDLMGLERTGTTNVGTAALDVDKLDPGRFDSSASEEYVTALTTQAIIERVPKHIETSTSESSDQEPLLSNPEPQVESGKPEVVSEVELPVEGPTVEEAGQQEDDVPEDNDDGQVWLVQKKTGDGECDLEELFLTMNEKELREKSTTTGYTTTRWSLELVESCEKINDQPATICLTFNTVRKTCRERIYIMDLDDAQDVLKKVRSILEGRSLSAMHQVVFRCMKCSSMFCLELQPTVSTENKQTNKCSTCGSTLVVEVEEIPLPAASSSPQPPSVLRHSPDCSIGSAASLVEVEQMSGDSLEDTPPPRRYDSDIEVISNPSQSSIEVLEVQARLQGTLTPSRKRSNEERPTVAVPQLNTVPEVQNNLVGLTESSSSGSLTDSVCTAYENNPIPVRRTGMSDVPEEVTPSNSTNTYTSLLEGLIQTMTAKLHSPATDCPLDNNVLYSVTDFTKVDHRVKLHLFQNTFKDDNEELSFLLRGHVLSNSDEVLPVCLVVSTHSLYILQVVSPEIGEDASQWFHLEACYPRSELLAVFPLPWQLGAGFRLRSTVCLFLLNDASHTRNLFRFLSTTLEPDGSTLSVEEEPSTKPERLLEQLIVCSASDNNGPVDSSVRYLVLCTSVTTRKDKEEKLQLGVSLLATTSTDVLLLKPQFSWLVPSAPNNMLPSIHAHQQLANIIDVSLSGLRLKLHYINENENQEEVWSMDLSSMETVESVVESIKGPWERLFSVPLQLSKH